MIENVKGKIINKEKHVIDLRPEVLKTRNIKFIDNVVDENNNPSENHKNNNNVSHRNHLQPQVKFVTHFSNIKEDEDDRV